MVNRKLKKQDQQTNRNSYRKKILLSIGAIILVIASLILFNAVKPHPLGDKMDYLGKTSTGSWLPVFRWAEPIDTYYYGTDMTPDELADYFNAKIIDKKGVDVATYSLKIHDKSPVVIFNQDRKSPYSSIPDEFENTSKKYIVEIYNFHYDTFDRALDE